MVAVKRKNDGKHGRQQLRKVTRTARRDKHQENIPEPESELELEPEIDQAPNPEPDSGMAYNALLTLISQDHQEGREQKQKQKHQQEQQDDEDIVGFNVEPEADDDDGEVDSDEEDTADPYNVHFNNVTDDFVDNQKDSLQQRWPVKSRGKQDTYTYMYQVPPSDAIPTSETIKPFNQLGFKKRVASTFDESLTEQESLLLNAMAQYKDINFPYFKYTNQSYKKLYALHALNHIYKTRDTILKNNTKIHNHEEQIKQGKPVEDVEYRDQGFTRPKVLILLPTRDACHEVVNLLMKYSGTEQQDNRKRFNAQFHTSAKPPDNKPDDFKHYFKGNTNDYFTLGIKFTRKSLKLYSSFYSSDIILASPIGLSMILEHGDKRKREQDFLSSIEVVVVDNANQIEMQSWDHVNTVFKYLNKVPKSSHDADFSRIRMWSINDQASYFTQRLVFSEYQTPNINNVVNRSLNLAGKLKFKKVITSDSCIMNSVGLKVRQTFQRFQLENPVEDPDARFKFFTNTILNSGSISTSYDDGLMIIVPSYFDFLRLKQHLQNHTKLNFAAIDEYTSQSRLTRARQQFIMGKIKVLLYSERLHHFRRFEIGGVKNILLYGVPTNPLFYKEYLKFIGKSVFNDMVDLNLAFIKVIFSKWDAVALERIVGNERAPILCNSVNETYEFK